MNAMPSINGPICISRLQEAVWSEVLVEDFQGNIQKFRIVSYTWNDLIKLEAVEWEYAWVKVIIDLATNSIVDAKIKTIKLWEKILFHENFISEENRWKSITSATSLSLEEIIEEERDRYKSTIRGLLSSLWGNWALPNSLESDDSTWDIMRELGQRFIDDGIISEDYLEAYMREVTNT